MKRTHFIAATALLAICIQISATAQTTATWKGGKPGREYDWNCAANWKEGRTPNEYSLVLIPAGMSYYPVIKKEVDPIDGLMLEAGSALTLQNDGALQVLGATERSNSLILKGHIENHGTLKLDMLDSLPVAILHQVFGNGEIVLNGATRNLTQVPSANPKNNSGRDGYISMDKYAH